ncbi:MAG TPA: NAD(P)/FAD-dependent oxidoreductase [Actinomycetes bacterium]|nr:NAD(P)/FAD-dependent oxidoreductase [Actinomycetes bacterium]
MNVVVVGGGPVGMYAAIAAAMKELSVTVIEKRPGPVDKACGEGLMPSALAALDEIGVDPSGVDFRGIRYLDAGGARQVHASLGMRPGRGVRRTTLMTALEVRAAQLAIPVVRDRVESVDQSAGVVSVAAASGAEFEADVVLACDGLGSTTRDRLGLDVPHAQPARFGLRQHYEVSPWSDDVEVYWGRDEEAYVTPVAPDLVGVAVLGPRGGPLEARLQGFPALVERLRDAVAVGPVLGAGPLRRQARRPLRDRVLLVGDAAGYVDALTGEGLAVGFASARAAVAAVVTGDREQYSRDWRRVTRRFRWSTEVLLRTTQRQGPRRAMLPLADTVPSVFREAVRQLA